MLLEVFDVNEARIGLRGVIDWTIELGDASGNDIITRLAIGVRRAILPVCKFLD
jgi:hypothetical protein